MKIKTTLLCFFTVLADTSNNKRHTGSAQCVANLKRDFLTGARILKFVVRSRQAPATVDLGAGRIDRTPCRELLFVFIFVKMFFELVC